MDFYTNSNFTKGTRMLAPITMMYIGNIKGKLKGEHMKDRSNVDVELLESIYKGELLKDFDAITEAYEQTIGPKEVFDALDVLGGKNSPLKNYRLMLDPKIAKDIIDLASGRDMYSILLERYGTTQAQFSKSAIKKQLDSYSKKRNIGNSITARNKIVEFSKSEKKRGMSTFDFDDTVGRTKSGVRYTQPNPSGKPAPRKKVIFLAGGAGSGKSNVIKQLG